MTESALRHPPLPTGHPAWSALRAHGERLRARRLKEFFTLDPERVRQWRYDMDGLVADFSRQRIDPGAATALFGLARAAHLEDAITALFAGEKLNFTEGRPALHMALRGGAAVPHADQTLFAQTEARMRHFANTLRSGQHRGCSGLSIQRVVHLGIGGSDLGPRMVYEALDGSAPPKLDFVANLDPAELETALTGADPARTLFIVCSKSFATPETLNNARRAKAWLEHGLGATADLRQHFAAVTNAVDQAVTFGIDPLNVFALPEWVGGRYSLWSAIGVPLLISLGENGFNALREGARSMDVHFRNTPFERNLPVLLGLIDLWNASILGIDTRAVLPYSHGLRTLPAWLQQLEMESNGKRCRRDGRMSGVHTAQIVWGMAGTNGQHAFHQLFYQGTRRIALEFVVVRPRDESTRRLAENALAQASALMNGRSLAEARAQLARGGLDEHDIDGLAPHLVCPGDQPSTTLLLPELTPYSLGQLLALYEHKVFVQGWLWGINSFDQFGVELGKQLARALADGERAADPAMQAMLDELDATPPSGSAT